MSGSSYRRPQKRYRVKYKGRIIAIVFVLIIVAAVLFINSAFFEVELNTVTVSGDERYHTNDIKSAVSTYLEKVNIFSVDEPAISDALETAYPYLTVEDIIRSLPNKVEIVVKERKKVMQFSYGGGYYDATLNGVIMSDARSKDPALMLVTGIAVNKPSLGKPADYVNEQSGKDLSAILDALDREDYITGVAELDFSDADNIIVRLNSGYSVVFGLPVDISNKVLFMKSAEQDFISRGESTDIMINIP